MIPSNRDVAKAAYLADASRQLTFSPLPWQIPVWNDKRQVLVLSSGAGTGKSRIAAEKVHGFLSHYREATGLALRKNRSAMINSTVLFLEREVIGLSNPDVVHKRGYYRFEYNSTGSMLAYGGLKDEAQRENIRSVGLKGGVDIALIEEANKTTREDINEVLARIRGTAAPWTQLILCTNPDSANHHIYTDFIVPAINGEDDSIGYYTATVYDNHYVSADYVKTLEMLTGVQKERLLHGRWVQSTGLVFDNWEDDLDSTKMPIGNVRRSSGYIADGGPVVWWIDDGMTGELKNGQWTSRSHPRAILFVQLLNDGKVHIIGELYKANALATANIILAEERSRELGIPLPSYVVCDRASASLHKAIRDRGYQVRYNAVPIDESIKEVKKFIGTTTEDRRLFQHPRCTHLRVEWNSFAYAEGSGKIIKAFDHGLDAVRYGLWDYSFGKDIEVDVEPYVPVSSNDVDNYYVTSHDNELTQYGIDVATYNHAFKDTLV